MKNKIQSFVGSRLEGRKGNTQRTSNLSPTNHQRYHRTWGAIFTLVMLFTFAIGNVWAADPKMPTECMEFPTNSTYMSSLQFNGSSYTNKYYLSSSADTVILNQYLMNQSSETNSKKIKWITYNDKGSNGSNWNAAFGFKGWQFWNVNNQATIKSNRVSWYRIRGASKFIGLYNSASSSNKCIVSAYEITYSGENPVKSSTAAVTRTKQSSSADTIQLALNSSKEYIIELTSSSTSGYKMTEVMFIAPTCEEPATALSLSSDANATVYVDDEITFSTSGGNGGTITIAGSNSETISANNKWTATVGQHTFTASQAKNGNYCAQEDVLVLTVNQKTPVTSAVISSDAADKDHVVKGSTVNLTCTAENATTWQWYLGDDPISGATSSTYSVTANTVGTFAYKVAAYNSFNTDPVVSSAYSITVEQNYDIHGLKSEFAVPTAVLNLPTFASNTWNSNIDHGYVQNSNTYTISAYAAYQSASNQTWVAVSAGGSSEETWDATGVFAGSTAYMTTNASRCADTRWGDKKRSYSFRVKNATNASVLVNPNGNTGRKIYFEAYEVEANATTLGNLVEQQVLTTNAVSTLSLPLNKDKEYVLVVVNSLGSGARFYELALTFPTVAVTGVTLNKSSLTLPNLSASEQLTATVLPATATNKNVTWSIYPEGFATVTNGLVEAVAAGEAVVTVTTQDGEFTATCNVTVEAGLSSDATLSDLTVGGETVDGFAAATEEYNVELPFGTTSAPAVAGTANDANAKSVGVTQASALPGSATVVVTAEDNSTKTYTINFTVEASKDIEMVWKTSGTRCGGTTTGSTAIKSNNAAVSTYINQITFTNVEGSGDDGAEGSSSLNVGKKAGNMLTLSAKPGYAMQAMSFYGKIESADTKLEYSLDGGLTWNDLASTSSDDACYSNVFAAEEVHTLCMRSVGNKGFWIRNMQLTMIQACTPKTIAWTAAPASEYEVGATVDPIAASANNGNVTYAASNAAITVASNGALTINSLTNDVDITASVAGGNGTTYCAAGASVAKEDIKTYYLVKFNAQNETDAIEVKYYSGDAAIALPATPSYPGYVFQGWFDAAEGGNAVTGAITPEASRTVYAQWEAQCVGPTITTQPASANYFTGRTSVALTGAATAGNGGALTYTWYSCDDTERTNPVELAGAPTPSTAVVGTQYYYFTVTEAGCDVVKTSDVAVITVADKDMLCLVKANVGDKTLTYDNTSFYAENKVTLAENDQIRGKDESYYEGYKFQSGAILQVGLKEASFEENDIIEVYVGAVANNGGYQKMRAFNADEAVLANIVAESAENMVEGVNRIVLTEDAADLYFMRKDDYSKWNPHVAYVAVYRAYPVPVLTAMTVNGSAATIAGTNVAATIASNAELASLTIVPTFMSNDPTLTNGALGDWTEVSEGVYTASYVVTDKDGDTNTYTITLTRDVEIASVTISGETTVAEESQITLTATVLPDNVANKAVVWSSSDETKAVVDANGVVTGKAAGAVTITATAVADNTKKGTYDITVTPFIGTKYAYWFTKTGDIPSNLANDNGDIFDGAPTDGNGLNASMTVEINGVDREFTVTRRSGDVGFGTFHVPAGFTADLYMLVQGSGDGRTIQLKETTTEATYKSDPESFGSSAAKLVFSAIPAGNYSYEKVGNSRVAMMVAALNSYPLSSITLSDMTMRIGNTGKPAMTLDHAKAAIASQTWSIVENNAAGTTIDASTGVITAGTTSGTVTVKVVAVDAMNNEVLSNTCTVTIVNIFERVDVTGDITWNWNEAANTSNVAVATANGLALANYINGEKWQKISGTHGDYAYNTNANGSYQGKGKLAFHTTVPGIVKVTARRISHNANIMLGDRLIGEVTDQPKTFPAMYVPAGEVEIIADATEGMRVTKVEFKATADYSRPNLNPNNIGTLCWTNNAILGGATLYELAGKNENNYLVFDEVEENRLEAGKPYIFVPENGNTEIKVYNTDTEAALTTPVQNTKGMQGTFVELSSADGTTLWGNYVISKNHYIYVDSDNVILGANRAYVLGLDNLDVVSSAPTPGTNGAPRRRLVMGGNAPAVATDVDNIYGNDTKVQKILINGQLFIIRGDKTYDATGRLVK